MAAHSVWILVEWAEKVRLFGPDEEYRDLMTHALGYAPGCGEIRADSWLELTEALKGYDPEAREGLPRLQAAVLLSLRDQVAEWNDLGRPASHEEWGRLKYGEGR